MKTNKQYKYPTYFYVEFDCDEYAYLCRICKSVNLFLIRPTSHDFPAAYMNGIHSGVNSRLLRKHLRILILAHAVIDNPNIKFMHDLRQILDADI